MKRGKPKKRLPAAFFENEQGNMPVRKWLLSLSDDDRRIIGNDICTAELGWPVGMPLCRPISSVKGLWEIRSNLSDGRISRVLFCVHARKMVLLHGFIKKTQKTPTREIDTATKRMKGLTE